MFDVGYVYIPIHYCSEGLAFRRNPIDVTKTSISSKFDIIDVETGFVVPWIPEVNNIELYSEYECISSEPLILRGKLKRLNWYEHNYDYISRNLNRLGFNTSPNDIDYLLEVILKDKLIIPNPIDILGYMIEYFNEFYSIANLNYSTNRKIDNRGKKVATMLLKYQDACIIDYLNRMGQGEVLWKANLDGLVVKVYTYDGVPLEDILKQCNPGAILQAREVIG